MTGTRGDIQRPTSPHNHPQRPPLAPSGAHSEDTGWSLTGRPLCCPPIEAMLLLLAGTGARGSAINPPKRPSAQVLHCVCPGPALLESATPLPPWPLPDPPAIPRLNQVLLARAGDLIACFSSPITFLHDTSSHHPTRTTGRHFGLVLTIFCQPVHKQAVISWPFCFARSGFQAVPEIPREYRRATIQVHDGNDGCLGVAEAGVIGAPPADLFIPYTYETPLSPFPFPPLAVPPALQREHPPSSIKALHFCTSNCAAGRLPFIPPPPPHTPPCIAPPHAPSAGAETSSPLRCNSRPQESTADCCCLRTHDSLHDRHLIASLARPPLFRSFASDAQCWY
jgi:hypothetical protein